MSIRACGRTMPVTVGRNGHDSFAVTLTAAQRDFYAAVEGLPNHPRHLKTERVLVRCRCGRQYGMRRDAAYLSETPGKSGGYRTDYVVHLERARKRVACPSCGRDDGHTVPSRVVPG